MSNLIGEDVAETLAIYVTMSNPALRKDWEKPCKKFGNKLSELSSKTIMYSQKCDLSNQHNSEGLCPIFTAVVPNAYVDHTHCKGQQWCNHTESSMAKYKSLPYEKTLSDRACCTVCADLFQTYIDIATCLANSISTPKNDSFNQIVTSKIRKTSTMPVQNDLRSKSAVPPWKPTMAVNQCATSLKKLTSSQVCTLLPT